MYLAVNLLSKLCFTVFSVPGALNSSEVAVANDFLYPPCVSSAGEEDRGCGPAEAAAVRDRTHCENV